MGPAHIPRLASAPHASLFTIPPPITRPPVPAHAQPSWLSETGLASPWVEGSVEKSGTARAAPRAELGTPGGGGGSPCQGDQPRGPTPPPIARRPVPAHAQLNWLYGTVLASPLLEGSVEKACLNHRVVEAGGGATHPPLRHTFTCPSLPLLPLPSDRAPTGTGARAFELATWNRACLTAARRQRGESQPEPHSGQPKTWTSPQPLHPTNPTCTPHTPTHPHPHPHPR